MFTSKATQSLIVAAVLSATVIAVVLRSLSSAPSAPGLNYQTDMSVASAAVLSSAWTTVDLPSGWHELSDGRIHTDVVMLDSDNVWISARRALLHYEDDEFEIVDIGAISNTVEAMDVISTTDGWAGSRGGKLFRYNGTSWSSFTSPIEDLNVQFNDLRMVSASDGWACGFGTTTGIVIRWNGTSWSEVTFPDDVSCEELSIVASDDVWSVGHDGAIAHFGGTSWVTTTSPITEHLFAVDMVDADEGWAVGEGGAILYYDGTDWSDETSPTTEHLFAIDMISADEGWAGGRELLYYDGTSWETATSPVPFHEFSWISDIDMESATEGWAVGQTNLLLQFTDTGGGFDSGWTEIFLPRLFAEFVSER